MKQWRYNTVLASAMLMTTFASLIFFLPVAVPTAALPMGNLWEAHSSTQYDYSLSDQPEVLSNNNLSIDPQKKGSLSLKTAAIIGSNSVKAAILALDNRSPQPN